MSSYYGEVWDTYGVELDQFEGPSEVSRRSEEISNWSQWHGRSTPHNEVQAEWYEIASNASRESSNTSWWKGDSWFWDSWDGSSGSSRENWAYVTRRGQADRWETSDPWHQWHQGVTDE